MTSPSASSTNPSIAVIIPSLGEEYTLPTVISKVHASVPGATVVVVDGGSSYGMTESAQANGTKLVMEARRGYGRAIRTGIESVKADFYVMVDADDTYDISVIEQMLEGAKKGKVLVGRRQVDSRNMSFSHRIGNVVLSAVYRLVYRKTIHDTQSGFKVFPSSIARLLKEDGMNLSSEIILMAHLLSVEVEEVPVTYSPRHRQSQSKFIFWRDGIKVLMFLMSGCLPRYRAAFSNMVDHMNSQELVIPRNFPRPTKTERH